MSTNNEHGTASRARYYADPDATAHDLLNNAAELLQYARGLTELLAETDRARSRCLRDLG
jgi:hypothetical protein